MQINECGRPLKLTAEFPFGNPFSIFNFLSSQKFQVSSAGFLAFYPHTIFGGFRSGNR
ncbi:conserved hypothetical protein [delta proteobacterium NaphS2]|nr:conserved hypothetical protein [delta proteobacterium NaphS2]